MIIEKIPFFILSLIFGIVAFKAQEAGNALTDFQYFHFFSSLSVGNYGLLVYLIKAFVPFDLSAFHPFSYELSENIPAYYGFCAFFLKK